MSPKPCLFTTPSTTSPSLRTLWLLCGILLVSGCSPSLAPLYHDFETGDRQEDLDARISRALETAGWERDESRAPDTYRTKQRTLNRRLLYKTVVSLEIVPIGDDYIRVLIHPYRDNVIGARSKIPYLQSNVRRYVLPPLIEAFADEGLYEVGNAPEDTSSVADTSMAHR